MTVSAAPPATDVTPPVAADQPPPPTSRRSAADAVRAAGFLFPAVAVITVVLLVPFAITIYRILFGNTAVDPAFTGLTQYGRVFSDPDLRHSMINTLLWVVGSLALPVTLGLLIAVTTSQVRFGRIARLAIVLPYAMSGTVIAVIGDFMLRTDGVVNQALGGIGLHGLEYGWLLHWPANTIATIVFATWQSTGVAVVLFLVGLQTVPPETLEAAALDGADGWRRFRFVVFPQLRAVTVVVVGITLANALKTFDLIFVLTAGGPARSSETLALSMYRETFVLTHPGTGAASAVLLTLIVLAASWVYLRPQLRSLR